MRLVGAPQAAAKRAAEAEATGAKAAEALAKKAKELKAPLTFDDMLRNSIAQREAETSMTLSEEEIATLAAKIKKAFPGVV